MKAERGARGGRRESGVGKAGDGGQEAGGERARDGRRGARGREADGGRREAEGRRWEAEWGRRAVVRLTEPESVMGNV